MTKCNFVLQELSLLISVVTLNPATVSATVSAETASVVNQFQVVTVLGGGGEKIQYVRVCIRTMILKGAGSGTPLSSTSIRQVTILINDD